MVHTNTQNESASCPPHQGWCKINFSASNQHSAFPVSLVLIYKYLWSIYIPERKEISVDQLVLITNINKCRYRVATIALWFCLRLPSCGPWFESQAHHLRFFQFVILKVYLENNEKNKKEARIGPFLKKPNVNRFCTNIRVSKEPDKYLANSGPMFDV